MAFFLTASKNLGISCVLILKRALYIKKILLKLWWIGNRTLCRPIRFVIIRVINKIGRPCSGSPICLISPVTITTTNNNNNDNSNKLLLLLPRLLCLRVEQIISAMFTYLLDSKVEFLVSQSSLSPQLRRNVLFPAYSASYSSVCEARHWFTICFSPLSCRKICRWANQGTYT